MESHIGGISRVVWSIIGYSVMAWLPSRLVLSGMSALSVEHLDGAGGDMHGGIYAFGVCIWRDLNEHMNAELPRERVIDEHV